jgi:hypothetical protein
MVPVRLACRGLRFVSVRRNGKPSREAIRRCPVCPRVTSTSGETRRVAYFVSQTAVVVVVVVVVVGLFTISHCICADASSCLVSGVVLRVKLAFPAEASKNSHVECACICLSYAPVSHTALPATPCMECCQACET